VGLNVPKVGFWPAHFYFQYQKVLVYKNMKSHGMSATRRVHRCHVSKACLAAVSLAPRSRSPRKNQVSMRCSD